MRKSEEQQALATLVKGDERKKKLMESLLHADDVLLDKFEKLIPREKLATEFQDIQRGYKRLASSPTDQSGGGVYITKRCEKSPKVPIQAQ